MPNEIQSSQVTAPASAQPGKPLQAPAAQPQAGQGSSEGGAQSQQATPANFDPASILQSLRTVVREELGAVTREMQSERDKMDTRFRKRIEQLQAIGVTPTDEQRAVIAQQIAQEDSAQVSAPQGRPSPAAPEVRSVPQVHQAETTAQDPRDAVAAAIMQGAGITIDETDPEAALVDWSNPYTTTLTVQKAVEAKRARVAQASTPLTSGIPAGTNPIANINDPYTLLKEGLNGK